MESRHGVSKTLGDLLGIGMLLLGGIIVFVGFVILSEMPSWCLIPFAAVALVTQAGVSWFAGRRTTTKVETFSLVLASWFILWGAINLLGVGVNPDGRLLLGLSAAVYGVGYIAGRIGMAERNRDVSRRMAAARAQSMVKAPEDDDDNVIIDNKPRRKVMSLADRIRNA